MCTLYEPLDLKIGLCIEQNNCFWGYFSPGRRSTTYRNRSVCTASIPESTDKNILFYTKQRLLLRNEIDNNITSELEQISNNSDSNRNFSPI